ncbi:MAG: hypothetical protein AB1498_03790 [bacterium]
MKKYFLVAVLLLAFSRTNAFVKQDKINTTWENKDGYFYIKLGSEDSLRNGSVLIGFDNQNRPFFFEILGILGPNYSLFQRIELVWDNNENKTNKVFLDKMNLDKALEISEIYDSFDQVLVNKLKEAELIYKNAVENYDKRRLNLSKKYFEECLNIVNNYKDSNEILNNLNKDMAVYRRKTEINDGIWKKSMEQADNFKSEDKFKEALNVFQNLALDYPLNKKIRGELGLYYAEMGNIYLNNDYLKEAVNELEELLFIDPGANSMRRELAFLYYYQGDKDNAMRHFEKLLSSSKDESAEELRELINKLLFISSKQANNPAKGMCSLCLSSITGNVIRFTNGLTICDKCNEGQVHNRQDIKTYYKKIESFFVERYNMKIRNIKDFIPQNDFGLKEISSAAADKDVPFIFFKPVYTEYEVHYLDLLPRVLIIEGLTSEYVRLWLDEQNLACTDLQMETGKRGIIMFFKYVLLNHFLCREQIGRFIYQNDSASLDFRRIKAIVEMKGEGKLIEIVRKCFER